MDAWSATLPIGIFIGDFRPNAVSFETHVHRRDELVEQAVREDEHRRAPVRRHQRVVERDGQLFYHLELLRFLRTRLDLPYFVDALYRFLLDAVKDPTLIIPKRPRAPFVPPEKRKEHFGLKNTTSCRGPAWTPQEDAVLRRWFGRRLIGEKAGEHTMLSDSEWERVLRDELQGRRTKASVRGRLVVLNKVLLQEFLVGGYVPRDRVRDYMDRVLGEQPRLPPYKERKYRKRKNPPVSTSAAL
jgi:hypothetical protein